MTIATTRPMTLEEYLNYDDGTETRYELVDGVLVEMGAETDRNVLIALFLLIMFSRLLPLVQLRRGTEVEISEGIATSRCPDLLVLTEEGSTALPGDQRSRITLEMPAPALVVEVVSPGEPGEQNYDRDYIEKRREYALRGIPEYWIIDPNRQIILILTLQGQTYQEQQFVGTEIIASPTFPKLTLTVNQILTAGKDTGIAS
jgi:Uma2 family endonuclease